MRDKSFISGYFKMNFVLVLVLLINSCKKTDSPTPKPNLIVEYVEINGEKVLDNGRLSNIAIANIQVNLVFNDQIDGSQLKKNDLFFTNLIDTFYSVFPSINKNELIIKINQTPAPLSQFRLILSTGNNLGGIIQSGFSCTISTSMDSTAKFPLISDNELLTKIQQNTFKYFWDYAHPVSGLTRERLGSGETVTTGGSGFGLMAILVGINRGFITRNEGFDRFVKIVNFLSNAQTETFHGAYPHWLNGTSGKVIPFSTKDNGGDLVETAFLCQGLLAVKEFFKSGSAQEIALCDKIQTIYERVEWSWYTQDNQNVLYWHWSPNYTWQMNHKIQGWNEGLIVYVLAAASPTFPISKDVYEQGWARNGAIVNGKTFFNTVLPLGEDKGGPLFFSHYSFMGLNPTHLSNQYANYMTQNVAHSKINYSYCVSNPKNQIGFSGDCWGLTASDVDFGYTASSPNNDVGVIAPTAAISAFPYTPFESMKALKFFYYIIGDKIWGEYGFKDAFNLNIPWYSPSYLAIDQGPIIVMVENYRSAMIWNLFMQNSDVQKGLTKLGFTY